jgi:CRISPR-associated endonuclease/helicase Cas3
MPLVDHCADVAAVTEALLRLPTIAQRLAALTKSSITDGILAQLAVLSFLHDVGKAGAGFQSKRLDAPARLEVLKAAGIRLDQCGHTHIVGSLMFGNHALPAGLLPIRDWGGPHWLAALSHHGTPITTQALNDDRYRSVRRIWQPVAGYDPMEALEEVAKAAQAWFPNAFAPDLAPLPNEPRFIHAYGGLVSLADWIASNAEVDFFPYKTPSEYPDRLAFARHRASAVLRAMRIDVEDARRDLRRRPPDFTSVFGFPPRPMQRAMDDPSLGLVVAAEDETGAGKTEAALWRFKTLFEAGEIDALAFLLPTRVAAVALERRVRNFMERLFPDLALRPNVVLAVPGYWRADGEDAVGRLAEFKTLWPDTAEEGAAHRRWAAENTKRYLAAAAAVGTIDQALLSALPARHAHLRGFSLLRALLVIDEIHSSDVYMARLIDTVLRRHEAAGGHALLLSATLGSATRDALVGTQKRRPRIGERRDAAAVSAPPSAEHAAYPSVTDKAALRPIEPGTGGKRVIFDLRPSIDDPAAIAALALAQARRGARVLIVRNTVAGALAVQQALEEQAAHETTLLFTAEGVICPHHGRYAAEDRRLLDAAIETALGKTATRAGGLILTGSQTLEQSLDIDADFLITDLAPVDVLLQRTGRLHRHRERQRPDGFAAARAIVLTPADRDLASLMQRRRGSRHGLGSVYDNLLSIDLTWAEIEARVTVTIPDDNRPLVERATDGATLRSLARQRGGAWQAHWEELTGKKAAQNTAAVYAALDWNLPWDDVPWPELDEKIKTRLGLDDRLLDLPKPWTSPFGAVLTRIKIPGWMVPKNPPDGPAEISAASADRLELRWGERTYRYGRYGLETYRNDFLGNSA